jgi:shikimate kinase
VPKQTGKTVVLVGMMGSGKTTVGRILAQNLEVDFFDTDELIVASSRMTVAEIFESHGEAEFRRREAETLSNLVSAPGRCVVAVGGGAILDDGNRAVMGGWATVVWLRTGVETLSERVGSGEGRPLLAGGATESLRRIADSRAGLYESAADVIVDTDGSAPDEVARAVAEAIDSQVRDAPKARHS